MKEKGFITLTLGGFFSACSNHVYKFRVKKMFQHVNQEYTGVFKCCKSLLPIKYLQIRLGDYPHIAL